MTWVLPARPGVEKGVLGHIPRPLPGKSYVEGRGVSWTFLREAWGQPLLASTNRTNCRLPTWSVAPGATGW